jgi:hypothetical protein
LGIAIIMTVAGNSAMPKFKLGDRVERTRLHEPPYMPIGVIIRVIPDPTGRNWPNQYEVDFGHKLTGIFYENHLRLVKRAADSETGHI